MSMTPEQLRQSFLAVDLDAELEAMSKAIVAARDALGDESEQQLRNAIVDLHTRAAACLHLVATW